MATPGHEQQFSDEELDRNWKPSGRRPQSTVARSFSAELGDIFKIDESVADLDHRVDRRKHTISMQTNELQSLEARLREMEARLKTANSPGVPASDSNGLPHRPLASSFRPARSGEQHHSSKRPPAMSTTAERGGKQPGGGGGGGGGGMPPTPATSEDDERE